MFLLEGKIVKSGGKELALELEENGYVALKKWFNMNSKNRR